LSPQYEGQDEVANGYRERMADFLRELTEQTDLQIIMVTHEPEYGRVADVHHRFSGGLGKMSKVRTIKNETGAML
jgi:ABC-type lipoprotein export system ATPase subunit